MPYEKSQEALSTFGDAALEPMHETLRDYGLCYLRGGASDTETIRREIVQHEPGDKNPKTGLSDDPAKLRILPTNYREPDLSRKPTRKWTGIEVEKFARLHSRIIRLPLIVHSLTIQVFYRESCAAEWADIPPSEKADILRDLTNWPSRPYGVNARLRRYNSETGQKVAPIRSDEFLPIMLRAVRLLVNQERMLNG